MEISKGTEANAKIFNLLFREMQIKAIMRHHLVGPSVTIPVDGNVVDKL